MAVALIVRDVEKGTRRKKIITVEPTFSVNYAAGGQVLDFTNMTNPGQFPSPAPGEVPSEVRAINPPLRDTRSMLFPARP